MNQMQYLLIPYLYIKQWSDKRTVPKYINAFVYQVIMIKRQKTMTEAFFKKAVTCPVVCFHVETSHCSFI